MTTADSLVSPARVLQAAILATTLLGATGARPVAAQSAPVADPAAPVAARAAVARVLRTTAQVEVIDAAQRTLVLQTPSGTLPLVAADVRNFGEIRVGDLVSVRYLEAVSIAVMRASQGARDRVERRAGDPAASGARRVTVVADVIAKDAQQRTATLRAASQTVTVKVSDPEQLRRVNVGDRVEATYTEAMAVSIEPTLASRREVAGR